MNKNLLMTFEEYSRIKHETPYFYYLNYNDQLLYYFGSNHSHDPNHQQFRLLKEKWDKFIDKTKGIKILVILETHKIPKRENTLEESIIKYGESGALAYLAYESKSLIIAAEPETDKIIDYLLKDFSKEEILFWYECQAIKFWQGHKRNRSIEKFLSSHTDKYRKLLKWPDLTVSIELINTIYKKIFNQELDVNDDKVFSEITTPITVKSRINELSQSQSIYRNEYILEQIERYWKDEYNIFIIYGSGHAVMQESAIRSLI